MSCALREGNGTAAVDAGSGASAGLSEGVDGDRSDNKSLIILNVLFPVHKSKVYKMMALKDDVPLPSTSTRPKQLLFDRRYGWVYEEWSDPVVIANIGGRGMFSVVPLTAGVLDGTLRLANLAADVVARALLTQKFSIPQTHERTVDLTDNAKLIPVSGALKD